jgi:hypothetical protein
MYEWITIRILSSSNPRPAPYWSNRTLCHTKRYFGPQQSSDRWLIYHCRETGGLNPRMIEVKGRLMTIKTSPKEGLSELIYAPIARIHFVNGRTEPRDSAERKP